MIETFEFKDIIVGLKEGKFYSCLRWKSDKVYIFLIGNPHNIFFNLRDENRNFSVSFAPTPENIFIDRWYEVRKED